MKSIKSQILSLVVSITIFTAIVCGMVGVINCNLMTKSDAEIILKETAEVYGKEIDMLLAEIEMSVNTLASVTENAIDDVEYFKSGSEAVDEYTKKLESFALECAKNTEGALTYYIRYNPELAYATSGLFCTRNNVNSDFESLTPTDFSIYSKTDLEHVGWYYIPVNNGAPTWMDPYLNSNINVYMISYVVPIFKNGESIGIVGMDIDFTVIEKIVSEAVCYNTGFALLVNAENSIMYHPTSDYGTKLSDISSYLDENVTTEELKESIDYTGNGTKMMAAYSLLKNGMKLIECVSESEALAQTHTLALDIFWAMLVIVLVSMFLAIVFSNSISKPIVGVTELIKKTAELDFRKNDSIDRLIKRRDETGDMSKAVLNMQEHLAKMLGSIEDAKGIINSSVDSMTDSMAEVERMCEKNYDITMRIVSENNSSQGQIDLVNDNAGDIKSLSNDGMERSLLVKERAAMLLSKTADARANTKNMYVQVRQQTDEALEKSQAVKKINEMINEIIQISSNINLLSINASIEAARAGEAGKGFSVVASEVGSLAAKTRNTVDMIQNTVSEVNDAVNHMIECMDVTMKFLEENVLKDYEFFGEVGENYSKDAGEYESGMEQINLSIQKLVGVIGDMTVSVRDIAEQNIKMMEQLDSNKIIIESSHESVDNLNRIVEEFKL